MALTGKSWSGIAYSKLDGFYRNWALLWRDQMRDELAKWFAEIYREGYRQGRLDAEDD